MLQSMASVSNGSNFIEPYQTEDEYKSSTDEPSDIERLSENLIESAKTSEENPSEPFDNDQIQPSNIEADNEVFTGIKERDIEETTNIPAKTNAPAKKMSKFKLRQLQNKQG